MLVYSPDRLARKFAYQALLIEEFARAGTRVEFVNTAPRGDSPEDQLLVQFQGMFAEYEKAQIMERFRRGKIHRARTGSVNVLSGAPFGYRYVRKTEHAGAAYEIVEDEAALVAELFRRYADDGASIADLARWLTGQGVPTRTGKPAGTGRWSGACCATPPMRARRVRQDHDRPRTCRAQPGRPSAGPHHPERPRPWTDPRGLDHHSRPRDHHRRDLRSASSSGWPTTNASPPAIPRSRPCCRAWPPARRADTPTTGPPPAPRTRRSSTTGAWARTTTATRAAGSAHNKPVRADYLDTVVWDHITGLLADPALIRAEIDQAPGAARTSDPVTATQRLDAALAKTTTAITRMIKAFSEQLITIDELRARMPDLRAREANLRSQLDTLDRKPPTATPTSNSPTTSKDSSPNSTNPPPPPSGPPASPATSRQRRPDRTPRRSPSDTASRPAPAPAGTTDEPDTEGDQARVIHCVGGVISPLLANIYLHAFDRELARA